METKDIRSYLEQLEEVIIAIQKGDARKAEYTFEPIYDNYQKEKHTDAELDILMIEIDRYFMQKSTIVRLDDILSSYYAMVFKMKGEKNG